MVPRSSVFVGKVNLMSNEELLRYVYLCTRSRLDPGHAGGGQAVLPRGDPHPALLHDRLEQPGWHLQRGGKHAHHL